MVVGLTLPDDSGMSAAAGTTATASPWVPVIAASVGAAAALIVGVLTQLWSGRREKLKWDREREDRRQQWDRERANRWLQERQQAYARLTAALHEWDEFLVKALPARVVESVSGEKLDDAAHFAMAKATSEALALVGLIGSLAIFKGAADLVEQRYAYWMELNRREPPDSKIDTAKLTKDLAQLTVSRYQLMSAMRDELGVEGGTGNAGPADG
jgi:hypothetical protein